MNENLPRIFARCIFHNVLLAVSAHQPRSAIKFRRRGNTKNYRPIFYFRVICQLLKGSSSRPEKSKRDFL
jgi:hypothetical protein